MLADEQFTTAEGNDSTHVGRVNIYLHNILYVLPSPGKSLALHIIPNQAEVFPHLANRPSP